MNNIMLGKTIKAMYKLSGKTLTQLSDETDLTIDTINNLFYARIQKPGFIGVNTLIKAMGFSLSDLTGFMEKAETFPADADFVEEFTKYLASAEDTDAIVKAAEQGRKNTEASEGKGRDKDVAALSESFEKQLEHVQENNQKYVETLQRQYHEQIDQMTEAARELKAYYDHSVSEIKKTHAAEMERQDKIIAGNHRIIMALTGALTIVVIAMILLIILLRF